MLKKIVLVCDGGISISVFGKQVQDRADSIGYHLEVQSSSMRQVKDHEDIDLVLLAPQLRFQIKELEKAMPHTQVANIDMRIYGRKDEDALIKEIQKLI